MAPAVDDPDRGRYLTLMVHASSALEPAIEDILLKRESDPAMVGSCPARDELGSVEGHLGEGPYLFGERFTAADVMIGGVTIWTRLLGVELPAALDAYVARLMARPALMRLFEASRPTAMT